MLLYYVLNIRSYWFLKQKKMSIKKLNPCLSVCNIHKKWKCTVMCFKKPRLSTGRSYSKYILEKKIKRERLTTKINIPIEEENNQGTSCNLKLGSCIHFFFFLSNSLLHFRWFFLFNERTFPMTLCSNRTVSCHIRDWFLTKYKVADRHLETR